MDSESELLRASWRDNAGLWIEAVRQGLIPSRRAGTDAAIVETVRALSPRRVLDAGCGEGWLVRVLAAHGIAADGFDTEPALIAAAQSASPAARFFVADCLTLPDAPAAYDAVVLNFALFTPVLAPVLAALARRLLPNGALVVQTLHPLNDTAGYRDGWRSEAFASMPGEGWSRMPWYFHTLESWFVALAEAGLSVSDLHEPRDAGSRLLSLILVARPRVV